MAWVRADDFVSLARIIRDTNGAESGPLHILASPYPFAKAQNPPLGARIIRDTNGAESGPLHILTSPYPFKSALTTTSLAPSAKTTGTPIS